MKKIILAAAAVLISSVLSAQTGTAGMSPAAVGINAYHPVLNLYYMPGAAGGFSGGSLAVNMNQSFIPSPSTITSSPGVLSAKILVNGVTPAPIDASNITISGYAVTITALTVNAGDILVITYGQTATGGLYGPGTPGAYTFSVSEKRSGAGSFVQLDKQPVLYVSNMAMDKSCSASSIKAGDTFTYTITYRNNDTGNAMSGLYIWDTMPQGVAFMSSVPPASYSGGCYSWNIGSVSANFANTITITAAALPGIINFGKTSVNSASVGAVSSLSQYNTMVFSRSTDVLGVIIQSSITAAPDLAAVGSHITVVMNVTNAGNLQSGTVSPSLSLKPMGGSAALAAGPVPSVISSLAPDSSASFTWIYTATSAGSVAFTGHGSALEGSALITANDSTGNIVTIINPTATSTPVLPSVTSTTVPPTATSTSIIASATSTPAVPAKTNTPVIVPTRTPVVIPDSVRGGNVFTDKNYMKQGSGDRIRIYYEAPADGKLEITVFNLSGEKIRYFSRNQAKGPDFMDWDGKNEAQKPSGKGIYFIKVKMGKWEHMKKVVIMN